jgi:N-acetylmuramoyl-L-alanine amidase
MSSSPTRVECELPLDGDAGSPLQEGNRVLESIVRKEPFPALLAFSELHDQIRNRRNSAGGTSYGALFETERFILDEVLQLICDRAQAITQADSVVIALAEQRNEHPESRRPEMVCRAAAGVLRVARGDRLIGESEFLQDALESGGTVRCDDGETDSRVELDFSHQLGARSSVLVPLRGRREQLGVLQAFSTTARAFTDNDERSFELFAELVLSALKPEDQDRRIHWLSDVAAEVLQTQTQTKTNADQIRTAATVVATAHVVQAEVAIPAQLDFVKPADILTFETESQDNSVAETPELFSKAIEIPEQSEGTTPPAWGRLPSFLTRLPLPVNLLSVNLRPGMNGVMALVAVAALFSAGAWWGMQTRGKTSVTRIAEASEADTHAALPPRSVTAPPPPHAEVFVPVVADNLMNPTKTDSDSGSLTAANPGKLAALPKITGVRHWTSSSGSTVVIDMEDPVPYEVHRLMSPERIYFDLHDTVLSPGLDGAMLDVGDVSLTRVRVAQPVAGLTRIVLDTRDGSNFSVSMESNPYRLVVELRADKTLLAKNTVQSRTAGHLPAASQSTANQASNAANLALAAKAVAGAAVPVKAPGDVPLQGGKLRIVLDAGHGGWDLGAVGRQGVLEKDLVLDVAQRLGKLLQTRLGSEVMFTRDGDTYLSLDQRADFANQAQADLFVSVHANYSSSATARGVETYYTNLFSAPGSREVEKHEDGTFAKLTPVSLSSGGLHEKIEESRKLAASVQRSLYATLASNSPDIRNRGIKDSAFVVLTGTTMPSILTEISFVSSPTDEHNLQSTTYRQQIAEALYQGIARYRQSSPHASPHAKVAQLQTAAARQ